jgi:hypothetical protein
MSQEKPTEENGEVTGQVLPGVNPAPAPSQEPGPAAGATNRLTGPETAEPAVVGSELGAVNDGPKVLEPLTPLEPRRPIDLSKAVLPEPGNLTAVESLTVKELKGVGATFTANLGAMLMFLGLVYKPQNEYETYYQIIAPPLDKDPRVLKQAKRIAIVPAYSWATFEVVLMPVKQTTFGRKIVEDLSKLKARFGQVKTFVQWDDDKHRHVVYFDDLSSQELTVIAEVKWPTRQEILEALRTTAFDDLNDLVAANPDIRALVYSKEVK